MTENNVQHNEVLHLKEQQRVIAVANQNSVATRIVHIIYFMFGLLEALLALRVVLHLLGANAENGFANFIFALSMPFLASYTNLLQNPMLGTTSTLEVTTIIAMIVFAILAWLVGRLAWLMLSRQR